MRISKQIHLIDARYTAQVGVMELSSREEELLHKLGQQYLQTGGLIEKHIPVEGQADEEVSFSLPSREVRFPLDLPVSRVFDTRDNDESSSNASYKAEAWLSVIVDRITEIRDNLFLVEEDIQFIKDDVETI